MGGILINPEKIFQIINFSEGNSVLRPLDIIRLFFKNIKNVWSGHDHIYMVWILLGLNPVCWNVFCYGLNHVLDCMIVFCYGWIPCVEVYSVKGWISCLYESCVLLNMGWILWGSILLVKGWIVRGCILLGWIPYGLIPVWVKSCVGLNMSGWFPYGLIPVLGWILCEGWIEYPVGWIPCSVELY